MAITRAQIPEQIDVFSEGGGATSITPEDILAIYGQLESQPVTPQDIQAQADMMSGLFPQPRKSNIYDLASAVGAGMVAGASDPGGFGVGLTAGLQSFNQRAEKIKAEKDKMRQELAMLAYQQVEAKRKEQLEMSKEIMEMQFKAALEGAGGMFSDGTTEGAALNYILAAEARPELKDTPEYKIAIAVAGKAKVVPQQTETGTIMIEQPGLDIEAILGEPAVAPQATIKIGGATWTFTGRRDANGTPIYTDGTQEKTIRPSG